MSKINFGEEVKKMVLAGVGAAALTAEKAQQIVDYCVDKGEITVEQGKVVNEELKRNVKDAVKTTSDKMTASIKPKADELMNAMEDMTAEEIKAIKDKLAALETKDSDDDAQ
ncbi:MAG: hypothetical protein PHI94_00630 [Eubacteriaceae bacterium]|jgi:polyhydroxyalkanoate synthesis regulator phasin|nr:hypothetical protein [Eubacteriaceae bacterium]MDD4507507.1 hypothetical protein [Eubacteriaceae bacterium]